MSEPYILYILSDSVGETAELLARAVAEQFKATTYEIRKFPYVENLDTIRDIIEEASNRKSVLLFTTVLPTVRDAIVEGCKSRNVPHMDIMSPMMDFFAQTLQDVPLREPGIIHRLDENYFKRVEAVEFAVKYDDGKDPRGVKKADVVILGVSRTSKTPLSMYLAHKNVKVANIPLVPEVPVPAEVYEISNRKIIGLTNNPIKLNEIRQERLKALGLDSGAAYASLERILMELEYAEGIMKRIGCPIIDVSSKAVEETANIILEILKANTKKMGE